MLKYSPVDYSWKPSLEHRNRHELGDEGGENEESTRSEAAHDNLVARNLTEESNTKGWSAIEAFIDKKSWHPAWQETLLFIAGLVALDDAFALLRLLADPATDDATRQRLCLAGHCLPELSEAVLQAYLEVNQSQARPSQQPNLPDVAAELLEIWWRNEERFTPFIHVENALSAFGASGAAVELASDLCKRTLSSDMKVRARAAEALGNLGPAAASDPVVKLLTECLCDADGDVRSAAAEALGKLGRAAATNVVLNRMTECLRDGHTWVRNNAADALGNLWPLTPNGEVLRRVTKWLRHDDGGVRSSAAAALEKFGPSAVTESVVNRLVECLKDRNVWSSAVGGLRNLGPAAATHAVVNRLTARLSDSNSQVRFLKAAALGSLGPPAATNAVLKSLTKWLRDEDWATRSAAARVLESFLRGASSSQQ